MSGGGDATADKDKKTPLEPIKSASDQPLDEKKLVEYVRKKVDDCRQNNSRIALEGIYLTNVAYLMGFDGVYFDSTYRQFKNIDPKRKLTRGRFRVNKVLPTIQNRLSRLTQSPPRFDVRPNSNESNDKDCARLGVEIIRDVFDKQRMQEKIQDALMSAMQGGHSYLQATWDPELGDPMYDPETEEFLGYEGDVRIEVLNCLEVFPDPLAKSIPDCQFIVKAKVRKLDYFRERYPERGDAVKEEGTWLLSSIYDMKANAMSSVGVAGASTQEQMTNSAIELVYYEKRSKEHPNGRMVSCASGILLEDKELPIGEYDLVKLDDIMIGGRYNSEAVITHLRPIQDQYNIARTKCADWVQKMLAGKYIAAKQHNLGQESINNESGEVLMYNAVPNAPPPQAMQIPMIPQYVYKEIETMDGEFDQISGINEVSRGVLPSASIPAAGMAFLQEQDQTRIGVQTTRNEIAYSKLGSAILKYVGKFYEMPRMLKTAGEGLAYTVKSFKGQELNGNYDVIVVPGSTIPQSKVLRRQDLLNAFQMGLLGSPQDPETLAKVLEMMEYGDEADMWKDQALDEAQVNKVISQIEEGDEIGVKQNLNEFDNHSFHLRKMNRYRKGDKYQELDQPKKDFFMWVMNWHLQALINIQNPEIAQQQQMSEIMANKMEQQLTSGQMPMGQNTMMPGGMPPGGNGMTAVAPRIDAQGNIQAPPPAQAPVPNAQPPIK